MGHCRESVVERGRIRQPGNLYSGWHAWRDWFRSPPQASRWKGASQALARAAGACSLRRPALPLFHYCSAPAAAPAHLVLLPQLHLFGSWWLSKGPKGGTSAGLLIRRWSSAYTLTAGGASLLILHLRNNFHDARGPASGLLLLLLPPARLHAALAALPCGGGGRRHCTATWRLAFCLAALPRLCLR